MSEEKLSVSIFETYKAMDEAKLDALLNQEIEKNDTKFVVLDDDPTGVQTVHDISVYTEWTAEAMKKAFEEENKVFYILTNSRGMTAAETTKIHHEIMAAVAEAAAATGKVISTFPEVILH